MRQRGSGLSIAMTACAGWNEKNKRQKNAVGHGNWRSPGALASSKKASESVEVLMSGSSWSLSAKKRKMKATMMQDTAAVSSMFQLSWLKYLKRIDDDGGRKRSGTPENEHVDYDGEKNKR